VVNLPSLLSDSALAAKRHKMRKENHPLPELLRLLRLFVAIAFSSISVAAAPRQGHRGFFF